MWYSNYMLAYACMGNKEWNWSGLKLCICAHTHSSWSIRVIYWYFHATYAYPNKINVTKKKLKTYTIIINFKLCKNYSQSIMRTPNLSALYRKNNNYFGYLYMWTIGFVIRLPQLTHCKPITSYTILFSYQSIHVCSYLIIW